MKKKILKIILNLIILLSISSGIILEAIRMRDESVSLIQEKVIIEYGEKYNPKLEELIDLSKYDFLDKSMLEVESNIVNEAGKEYPSVGEYKINVLYKNIKLVQDIKIIDTIAPEMTIQEIIEVEYNTDLSAYDFKKHITIVDLSELNDYKIDLSNINSSISGEYETSISVDDVHGNKTEKKFKIRILEKVEEVVEEKKEQKKVSTTTKKNKKDEIKSDNQKKASEKNTDSKLPETKEDINSNNTNTEDKVENSNQDIIYDIVKKPDLCTHGDENYYNTREEAIAVYKKIVKECDDNYKSGVIKTYDEYIKVCPFGHEEWTCMFCGKWTIRLYYRKD